MQISATATDASALTGVNRMSDLTSEEFLQILITELQNQDPFNPSDTNAMLEQISSIRNIESQMDLQAKLENLVSQNEISSASGLIGKFVSGLNENNTQVEGIVESLRIENGRPVLMVNDGVSSVRMPVDNVMQVFDMGEIDPAMIQSLAASMKMLDTNAMIGRHVEGTNETGEKINGVVTSVTVEEGQFMLELDTGQVMPASQVTRFAQSAA